MVEYRLAKARVAGSNPVSCFFFCPELLGFFNAVLYLVLHGIFKVVVDEFVWYPKLRHGGGIQVTEIVTIKFDNIPQKRH